MGNVLHGSARFNTVDAKRAVAGALLAGLALVGCSSGEQAPTTPAPTQSSPEPSPSPSETIVQAGNTVTIAPMSPEDITFTDNYYNAPVSFDTEEARKQRKDARFGAYLPEVVGINGACITKLQAAQNENVRIAIIASFAELESKYPDLYNPNIASFQLAQKLENPSKALIEAAATDEECPAGNNTKVVSFTVNGEAMQTTADDLLPFLNGIEAARKSYGLLYKSPKEWQEDIDSKFAFAQTNTEDPISVYEALIPLASRMQAQKTVMDAYGYTVEQQ